MKPNKLTKNLGKSFILILLVVLPTYSLEGNINDGDEVIDLSYPKPASADYASYQMGFYGGYIAGYVVEQLVVFGYITKALKSFAAGEKFIAVTEKATQALTRITNKFGSSVAYSLKSLDIWGKAVHWGDDVQDGMAYVIKRTTKGKPDEIFKALGEDATKRSFKVVGDNIDEWAKLQVDEFDIFIKDVDAWEGKLQVVQLDQPLDVWRVYGGETDLQGGWLTPVDPREWSIAKRKELLALPPENSAQLVKKVTIPKSQRVIYGNVGPRYGQLGGGKQIRLLSIFDFGEV